MVILTNAAPEFKGSNWLDQPWTVAAAASHHLLKHLDRFHDWHNILLRATLATFGRIEGFFGSFKTFTGTPKLKPL